MKKKETSQSQISHSWLNTLYNFISYPITHPIHALTYLLLFNQVVRTVAQSDSVLTQSIKNPHNFHLVYYHIQEEVEKAIQSNQFQEVDKLIDHYMDQIPDNLILMEQKLAVYFYNMQEGLLSSNNLIMHKIADKILKIDSSHEYALTLKMISATNTNIRTTQDVKYATLMQSLKPTTSIGFFGRSLANFFMGKVEPNMTMLYQGKTDCEKAAEMESDPEMKSFYKSMADAFVNKLGTDAYLKNTKKMTNYKSDRAENPSWFYDNIKLAVYVLSGLTVIGKILVKVGYYFSLKKDGKQLESEKKELNIVALTKLLNEAHNALTTEPIWGCQKQLIFTKTNRFLSQIDVSQTRFHSKYPDLKNVTIDNDWLKDIWLTLIQSIFKNIMMREDTLVIMIDQELVEKNTAAFFGEMINQILEKIIKNSPEYKIKEVVEKIKHLEQAYERTIHDHYLSYKESKTSLQQYQIRMQNFKNTYPDNKLINNKANDVLRIISNLDQFILYLDQDKQGEDNNNNIQALKKESFINALISFKTKLSLITTKLHNVEKNADYNAFFAEIKHIEDECRILEKLKNDIVITLVSYRNHYDNISNLIDDIKTAVKKTEQEKIPAQKEQHISYKKPKKEKLSKAKIKETPQERAARITTFKKKKEMFEVEKTVKKKQEEEKRRSKEEVNKSVNESITLATNLERLSKDSRYFILEHNLEIMAEALKDKEDKYLIGSCSGDEKLANALEKDGGYNVIVYYTLLHCVMRSVHSLGQMMMRYEQFNVADMEPYRARNALMHGSCKVGVEQTDLLCKATIEINSHLRGLMPHIRHHGFQNLPKSLKLKNELFSEDSLKNLEEQNFDQKFCVINLAKCFNHLILMTKVVKHLYDKNPENYLGHYGLIHHSVIGCCCVIGELLDRLNVKDLVLYNKLKEKITAHDLFRVRDGESTQTIFQDVRRKVGHAFTDHTEDGRLSFELLPSQEIFKELDPHFIHKMSLHFEKLFTAGLNPILEKELSLSVFFDSKMSFESPTFIPESEKYRSEMG